MTSHFIGTFTIFSWRSPAEAKNKFLKIFSFPSALNEFVSFILGIIYIDLVAVLEFRLVENKTLKKLFEFFLLLVSFSDC